MTVKTSAKTSRQMRRRIRAEHIFAFGFQAAKTNIEKSSILRKLKTQLNRS